MARISPSSASAHLWGVAVAVSLLVATVAGVGGAVPLTPTHQPSGPADAPADATVVSPTGITATNLSGSGIATQQNGTVYVWQDGRLALDVTMFPLDKPGEHRVCLDLQRDDGTRASGLGCRTVDVESTSSRTTFEVESLGMNGTGSHALVVTLSDHDENQTARVPVSVITRSGDIDSDSLNNTQELEYGTGIADSDTDSDGLLDGLEVTKYGSDPTRADSDEDGLRDGREININTEPTVADSDDDGLLDGAEVNEFGTDPNQVDSDEDGLDDAREVELGTDPTSADTDTDGLDDDREVELGTDPTSPDTDDDGLDDGTEVERGTDPLDADSPGALNPVTPWMPSGQDTVYLVVGTLLLGIVAIVGYAHRREPPDGSESSTTTEPPEPAGAATPDGAPGDDDVVDPELLSPEQHIMHLLETRGGRMRQSEFVEETDWSKAKVSRKLSRLEEEGKIERVRIGRENVVTYPDHGDA